MCVCAHNPEAELMDIDAATMRQDLVEANSLIADTELRIARQGEIIAELFAGGHSTDEDSSLPPLEAGKTYKLKVRKDMPSKQLWSLTIYCFPH